MTVLFGLVAGAFLALAGVRLFVWPPSSRPTSADAVIVLSGDHGERMPRALELVRSGVTSTLVEVGEPDSAEASRLCLGDQGFQVICLFPQPDNTRAEARVVGRTAAARGWRRVVLVTSTQHAFRAGVLFRRCVHGTVDVVPARPPFGAGLMAHLILKEGAKVVYVLTFARGC